MEELTPERQLELLLGSNRVHYRSVAEGLGDLVTQDDSTLAKTTSDQILALCTELERTQQGEVWSSQIGLPKAEVVTHISSRLRPILGRGELGRQKNELSFYPRVGDWTLRVFLSISGSTFYSVAPMMVILSSKKEPMPLTECTSIQRILGLRWKLTEEAQLDSFIESLGRALSYYVDAVSQISAQITDCSPYPYREGVNYVED
jgi:hypothetical protein